MISFFEMSFFENQFLFKNFFAACQIYVNFCPREYGLSRVGHDRETYLISHKFLNVVVPVDVILIETQYLTIIICASSSSVCCRL